MKSDSGKHIPGHEIARLQGDLHNAQHDYSGSSPHIKHDEIRHRIVKAISDVVTEVISRQGHCEVLEIGAGHGTFTDSVIQAGGTATVTEMSQASADYLTGRYENNDAVSVVVDSDGDEAFRFGRRFDVVLFISVIHHIPDYLDLLDRLTSEVVESHGSLVCFQDPLWYPRQSRMATTLSWFSYFAWRVPNGDIRRGLATRWRHARGIRNDSISDTVEYHVVRSGVDDEAIVRLLNPRFENVHKDTYFSTQSAFFQRIGSDRFPANTFSIVASGRL